MCLVFQHVNFTGNMRLALGLLTVQPVIWKELPLREIITVYVATQMHILPGGKCIE